MAVAQILSVTSIVSAGDGKNVIVTCTLSGGTVFTKTYLATTSSDDIVNDLQAVVNRFAAEDASVVLLSTALSSVVFNSSSP